MARAYAIDFVSDASGKHIKSSKYRILFRFGFSPNQHPVLEHEHVVTLSWSSLSGKAVLAADGQDVHMSNHFQTTTTKRRKGGLMISSPKSIPHGNKQSRFQHSWDLVSTSADVDEQSHSLEIVACSRRHRHQRQFDLIIDGVSYFDLPKYDDEEGRILDSQVDTTSNTATCASAAADDDDSNNDPQGDKTAASSPGSQSRSTEEGDGSWLDIDADVESLHCAVESLDVGGRANVEEFSLAEQLQAPSTPVN